MQTTNPEGRKVRYNNRYAVIISQISAIKNKVERLSPALNNFINRIMYSKLQSALKQSGHAKHTSL